ncbi:MAG: DoxX family protein [Candidatus Nitrosocosmicus sp.]|nr:DoxX family protein [Candidatus Nitrosocosmicus sp.]
MAEAIIRNSIFQDITHFGIRITIGAIFIAHSLGKFESSFAENLPNMGLPAEMQIPIALAELVPGILLIIGGLTRISASLLSIVMLGAIFVAKGAQSFAGRGGVEFETLILAGCLLIIVIGPGRMSISYILKKIPRILQ